MHKKLFKQDLSYSLTCRIEVLACQVRHACQGLPIPGLVHCSWAAVPQNM